MGNQKNHAKRNKRLANNWRKIAKTRKKVSANLSLRKKALDLTRCKDENVVPIDSEETITNSSSAARESDATMSVTGSDRKTLDNMKTMNQAYYVIQKGDPNQHTRIMRADFHQGDDRFEIISRDKQYAAISVIALFHFLERDDPETWRTADLNNILKNGDGLYRASYDRMNMQQSTPLKLKDILPYIQIRDKIYNLYTTEMETNLLNFNNLVVALNRFFVEEKNICGVFTNDTFSFAIMRREDSFYLLNSQATAFDGYPLDSSNKESAACLMQMFTTNCLADRLLVACNHRQMVEINDGKADPSTFFIISISFVEQLIGPAQVSRKRKQINVESTRRSIRLKEHVVEQAHNESTEKKMEKKVGTSCSLNTICADENQEEELCQNESLGNDVCLPEKDDKSENHVEETNNRLTGRRIVDIAYVMEQTKRIHRHSDRCDAEMVFRKETKLGFRSIFHYDCAECGVSHQVHSSTKYDDYDDINLAAALGVTSIGSGFYHLEEMYAHMNIPCMSSGTFNDVQKKLQKDWSELSKHHTKEALLVEIRIAKDRGNVDSAGNALICVICDGSWGKRSYGKGFSSLSGSAAIVGAITKKVLYFGVKNKYCHVCAISYANYCPPNNHDCNINYVGASSGMETEILVEGFLFSEEQGARFNKMISDGDSSAFKEITERCVYKNPDLEIEKIECTNHLFKNAQKKFTALCTDTGFKNEHRKMLKFSMGDDLCKGIRCAAKYWREVDICRLQKLENLEKDCLNAPYHYFGNHDNCARYFCDKKTTKESKADIAILKSSGLFHEILNYCNFYFANNVTSILEDKTNNAAEELNSIIAKYLGGKRINYSLAGSYTARVCAAVVQFNTDGHAGSRFHEFFGIIPNNYCLKIENARKNHYVKNEVSRQTKPRKRAVKDKTVKGYKAQREDLSERALEVAMNIEFSKLETNQTNRDTIVRDTYGQKHNQKWKEIRKKLINANYFARIMNARGPKSYPNIIEEMLYSPIELSNTAEMRHQRLYEPEALNKFSLIHKNYELEKTGIFIDEELCFLGASPLRLYGPESIVCVQCPVKAFRKTIDEAILKNLLPLTYKDGDIHIKEKSSWYIEAQGLLRITGRNTCYLVIWLGAEFVVKRVTVDPSFLNTALKEKLEFFFKEAMLKEIADSRKGRKMELRKYDPRTKKFA